MIRAPRLPDVPILIADPDEYSRRIVREVLRAARIRRIHETGDSRVLPQKLNDLQPGVVLLDLELPGLGHPAVVDALQTCLVGVVVTTRRATPGIVQSSRKVAAGGMIVKPFTPRSLWLRVQTVIRDMTAAGVDFQPIPNAQRMIDRLLGDL
jgi:AmiR/NasT family two-component response regulator